MRTEKEQQEMRSEHEKTITALKKLPDLPTCRPEKLRGRNFTFISITPQAHKRLHGSISNVTIGDGEEVSLPTSLKVYKKQVVLQYSEGRDLWYFSTDNNTTSKTNPLLVYGKLYFPT